MSEPPPDGSALCTACGLCCDGTLFSRAFSEVEEIEHLTAMGMTVSTADGKVHFSLPCRWLENTCCSIYEQRFGVCRKFRCKLLKACQEGRTSLTEAVGVVEEAKALKARAVALAPSASTRAGRAALFASARDWVLEKDPQRRREQAELFFSMRVLGEFLDRHFHDRPKERVKPQAGAPG